MGTVSKKRGNDFWPDKIIVFISSSIFSDKGKVIQYVRNKSQIACIMKTSKKEGIKRNKRTLYLNAIKRIL